MDKVHYIHWIRKIQKNVDIIYYYASALLIIAVGIRTATRSDYRLSDRMVEAFEWVIVGSIGIIRSSIIGLIIIGRIIIISGGDSWKLIWMRCDR